MTAEDQRWDVTTEEGFLACYDETFDDAYRCAARLTGGDRQRAEDLVQDTFVALLRAARSDRIDEVGPGWVITSVRHRFIDSLRSNHREERRMRLVAMPTEVDAEPHDDGHHLLGRLPDRERAALVFRYVDDLPVAEVAELLGTSIRATESLLQRAKRRVRRAEDT